MYFCPECFLLGYCRNLKAKLVSDAELASTAFIADVKAYAFAMDVSCDGWFGHLLALYRDYLGEIVDGAGKPVELDLEVFDEPNIRYWFRDFCKPALPGVVPRIRAESRERVRTLATILRAVDPVGAVLWGVRAANDGPLPPIQQTRSMTERCTVLAAHAIPLAIRFDKKTGYKIKQLLTLY